MPTCVGLTINVINNYWVEFILLSTFGDYLFCYMIMQGEIIHVPHSNSSTFMN